MDPMGSTDTATGLVFCWKVHRVVGREKLELLLSSQGLNAGAGWGMATQNKVCQV